MKRRSVLLTSALSIALTLAGGTAAHAVWAAPPTVDAVTQPGTSAVVVSDSAAAAPSAPAVFCGAAPSVSEALSSGIAGTCTTSGSSAVISWNRLTVFFLSGYGPFDVYLDGEKVDRDVTAFDGRYTVPSSTLASLAYTGADSQVFELRNVDTGAAVLTATVALSGR